MLIISYLCFNNRFEDFLNILIFKYEVDGAFAFSLSLFPGGAFCRFMWIREIKDEASNCV